MQPRVDLWEGFIQVRLACIGTDAAGLLRDSSLRGRMQMQNMYMFAKQTALGGCMIERQTEFQHDCVLLLQLRDVLSCSAVLCCAVLCCAVLCCAVLCCAVLCCAVHLLHFDLLLSKLLSWLGSWKSHACFTEALVGFPPVLILKRLVLCTNHSYVLTLLHFCSSWT